MAEKASQTPKYPTCQTIILLTPLTGDNYHLRPLPHNLMPDSFLNSQSSRH